jgi:ankyrin
MCPLAVPLYFAARRGFHGLVERLLIKHPQQVLHLGGEYGTALHASVYGEHLEIAQLLAAHGADINSRSARNLTPLHIASEMGHLKIVKWLLNHGADVNSKEARGPHSGAAFFSPQWNTLRSVALCYKTRTRQD